MLSRQAQEWRQKFNYLFLEVGSVKKTAALKALINDKETYYVPGVFDCIGAKVAEETGFKAVEISGNALAASGFGLPDMGLITMSEVTEASARIAASVSIPVIADADTGYGQPLNFMRTVREFERKGLAGIHIEDQISPKKCAYYGGNHEIVTIDEQLRKLRAGIAAKEDEDFCIIARTDALVSYGMDEAIYRANKYLEVGADAAFVVGCSDMSQIERLSKEVKGPLMIIINDSSAELNRFEKRDFADLGIKFVMYAATLRCLYLGQAKKVLGDLASHGNTALSLDKLSPAAEFQNITGLKDYQRLEYEYAEKQGGGTVCPR